METTEYPPPRQRGVVVHGILSVVCGVLSALAAWRASEADIGLLLVINILVAALFFLPLPFLAYRLYALLRAGYSLNRNSLRLHWGLRMEEIPISDVDWVRSAQDLTSPVRLPPFSLPGSLLGVRKNPDLGNVEFLASDIKKLILVTTARRSFAISPEDPRAFMQEFGRCMEMGSLATAAARSVHPSFVVAQAWESALARYLWFSGLFLNIGLLLWVSLEIPSLGNIPLGFTAGGSPQEAVPGVRLILLPILSFFFFLVGWIAGLFFYRSSSQRILALILWASGALMSLLFLVAILFILTSPG